MSLALNSVVITEPWDLKNSRLSGLQGVVSNTLLSELPISVRWDSDEHGFATCSAVWLHSVT